ncbi:tyrosine type site-specific recombinase [Aquipluma nitroreducens]|uniref:Tyrosine type site-specific recombinase n=1 Tax=Aquipluma nitroreducens TaxID=2010828 RepID=A0A5K7S7C8_9BACT|nr:tyrosine-type recombinase/integrase [Aquipluma nitroreducens]BBE17478.1 tyrosine type site-specific recombinase [Aquipluma nitroreducens]
MVNVKFKIRKREENGFVKFEITHNNFRGRVRKHIGKGLSSEYDIYLNDFSNDIERYFEGKEVTFDATQIYANDYVERAKQKGSIFTYSDEFITLKRNTFNKRTRCYLSSSSINSYIKSIKNFKQFLTSKQLSELPEVLNDSVLNDYYNYLHPLSHNYRVKMHFRIKEFITYLMSEKRLAIDISYLKSNFSEQYDNQETDDDDRALTVEDMIKLNSLRNEFNKGIFRLKAYEKSKTIPANLQIKQRSTKESNLKRTLDCFLFMCSTGMYVSDVKKIQLVLKSTRNGEYIQYRRAKNNTYCKGIPIIDNDCFVGKTLLKAYNIKSGSNFPLNLSLNQFDKNLKIISELAGLNINLTSKMGRKTFASIYYFTHRININDIQVMLGHKEIKHTMHYLRIEDDDFATRIQEQLGLTG